MVQLVNTRGCQFQLTSYGDKGAGLVALVDIEPGTLLISEPAILRVTLINGDLSSGASKDVNRQFSRLVPDIYFDFVFTLQVKECDVKVL